MATPNPTAHQTPSMDSPMAQTQQRAGSTRTRLTQAQRALLILALMLCAAGSDPPDTSGTPSSNAQDTPDASDQEDTSGPQDDASAPDAATDDVLEPQEDIQEDIPPDEPPPPKCPEGWEETIALDSEVDIDAPFTVNAPACTTSEVELVAPRLTTLLFESLDIPTGSFIIAQDALGQTLGTEFVSSQPVSMRFVTQISGAVSLRVQPPEAPADWTWSGAITCQEGCGREATRYPIVLFHGMAGTDRYFGLLEYFYNVPGELEALGYEVFTPVTDFIGPSEDRAERLAGQLDDILEQTGAQKVHMIGHSQGGIDMRVLVNGMGYDAHTASMTTISSPHNGIPIDLPDFLTGQNFQEGYMQNEFPQLYPDVESIPRFSWSGRTCLVLDRDCQDEMNGERINAVLIIPFRLLRGAARDDDFDGANDGIVTVASSVWGQWLGLLPTDHFDEVGQIADSREGPFDHIQFYLDEARRLRELEKETRP